MEPEQDLAEFRDRLIESIQTGPRRSACGTRDSIQVFVNQRRVGSLDGAGSEAALQVQSDIRVESVQVRSEDGVLLGGFTAPEYGFRTTRIPFRQDTIELQVQNYAEGGSVSALFHPAPSLWHRARRALAGVAGTAAPQSVQPFARGIKAVAFAQALLALAVVGLAADRVVAWKSSERTPPPITPTEAPWAAPVAEVAKLERQVVELSKMQMKALETIEAQQKGMSQLQNTIAKLASTQEAVASSVSTVKHGIEQQRKGAGRDVDRLTRLILSTAQTEQVQLEAEINSLTAANDRLSKELSQLEQFNGDLKKRLKSAGVDVSKAQADPEKPMTARQQNDAAQPATPPQMAQTVPAPQQPFLFWVTFNEGTSQESVDQWVRDMRGRKGALSEGWQAVEIQPPTEPMERFLDQIKQTKIVKAVKVSR